MIDYFALGLSHCLILLAVWRVLQRQDLDGERTRDDEPVSPG